MTMFNRKTSTDEATSTTSTSQSHEGMQSVGHKAPQETISQQDNEVQGGESGATAEIVETDPEADLPMDIGSSDSEKSEVELVEDIQTENEETAAAASAATTRVTR